MDGVHQILHTPPVATATVQTAARPAPEPQPSPEQLQAERAAAKAASQLPQDKLRNISSELQNIISAINRRMEVRYHEELGQVVVKVIDKETDKVIKELPPAELQRVHLRIREAIGLLFDEEA